MVGGEGTRLRPLTLRTPKPMVPLLGVPFLERTLVRLREAGVGEVILAAGYLPSAIVERVGDGSAFGVRLRCVLEREPLGTAGALRNVAAYIDGPFFVLNGDVLGTVDLRAMRALHENAGGLGVIHAITVDDPSPFGCIVRDDAGRISRFVEKPPRELAPSNEINAGTYLLAPAMLEAIPAGRAVSIERETFPQLLARGEPLYAHVSADYWLDVGRPEQYLQAHRDALDGRLVLAGDPSPALGTLYRRGDPAPPGIVAPSFIGNGTRIDANALVGPYAVVGRDCRIGAGASVRDSVLWDRVEIGAGASVAGAILADGVIVGEGASVAAGAVIGHGARIAAGARIPGDARLSAEETSVAPG
ncbi:MAG: sugar phosphate nucleotidyltransferase [Vulcanimicrobiaceae bacterium]